MIIYYTVFEKQLNIVEKEFWDTNHYINDGGEVLDDISQKLLKLSLSESNKATFETHNISIDEIKEYLYSFGYDLIYSEELNDFLKNC